MIRSRVVALVALATIWVVLLAGSSHGQTRTRKGPPPMPAAQCWQQSTPSDCDQNALTLYTGVVVDICNAKSKSQADVPNLEALITVSRRFLSCVEATAPYLRGAGDQAYRAVLESTVRKVFESEARENL